ncbi:MAG: flippase [Candidatus Buchananbacteria bacterium]|jgi:O-antigen/teichoic acid export membrane protein
MSLARKIARNTLWQVIGKVIATIVGLATIALMTRYLGQKGFGYYTTIISYLQFFGVLIDFGLQMTTAQLLSRPGADESKIFGNLIAVRLISAVLFLGTGTLLVFILPYPPIVKIGVAIASASFFFSSLQSVLVGLYQKHMAMAEVAIAEVWGRLALLAGIWLSVYYNLGFYPVIIAVAIGSFVNFAFLFFKSKKYLAYRPRLDKPVLKDIWDTSWPLAITISLTLVYFRADTIILSFVRPAEEVGIYGAAYKVLEILIQFPYLFLGLTLPLMTQFYPTSRELFNKILQKSFDFMAILAVPMVFATWLLAEKIMVFVAGSEFAVAGGPLRILIVATAMIYFGALFGYAIVATGFQKKMIGFYVFDAIFSLTAYLIFIPLYSYWAGATLTLLTEAIIAFSAWHILKKYTGSKIKLRIFGKTILSSLAMCAVLWPLLNQSILTLVIIGAVVYFLALYLLKGYDRKEVADMFTLKIKN